MEKQFEEHYHRVESDHWWFVGRREAVSDLSRAVNGDPNCAILDVGSSSGFLILKLLRDGYRGVTGIDNSADAIRLCQKAGLNAQVMDAKRLSLPDASADVLIASDILEHIEDEHEALAQWWRVLKPGGVIIVFVPAFEFLWTRHDVANQHFRRYNRDRLVRALEKAGFATERSSYWNALLFLPIVLARSLKRWRGCAMTPANGGIGDLFVPPVVLNTMLLTILRFENRLLKWGVNWPFGVSVMALARRPNEQGSALAFDAESPRTHAS